MAPASDRRPVMREAEAERAVRYIGDQCTIVEMNTSDHTIHSVHSDVYVDTVNKFLDNQEINEC